jgi:hypothetical protein
MGAKFGGWGSNLLNAAISTKLMRTFSFFESDSIILDSSSNPKIGFFYIP